jgi:diguanylate cyclase (GGDEF)-like protein
MKLRTRIAVTFLALLGAVTGAALFAVSAANQSNAEREITRQLEVGRLVFERALDSNRRQLTQAAQVLAKDFGFRDAVATNDADTIGSALETQGARINATLVELLSLDGKVIATAGSTMQAGAPSAYRDLLDLRDGTGVSSAIAVEDGHVYQLVMLPIRAPLPVAWIVMGFAFDEASVKELSSVTGLDVTLATRTPDGWRALATTLHPGSVPLALAALGGATGPQGSDLITRSLTLAAASSAPVTAVLSRSLAEAREPFDRLRERLVLIALVCVSLGAVAVFWLARNITRPLLALTSAIEAIRGGRYDAPLVVERRDELGTLAEGLQLMQQAVDSRDRDIRTLAYTDRLTGLMNRMAFTDALSATLAAPGPPLAVALVNLRRFRRINECLGYGVGDAVLQRVAARLAEAPSLATQLARVGADHFAACTPLGPGASLEKWGTQLLERLSRPVVVSEQPIDINPVVGLAFAPQDSANADDLMRCADLAVERARRENVSLRVYETSLRVATRDQLSLLGELQRAIDGNELTLALQPKLNLQTGELVGAEALMRWRHPTRGLLMPGAFIPFAENAGFIRKLTRWALHEGATIASRWAAQGRPLNVSVNMSADDLADPQLDRLLRDVLLETRVPSELMTLELTESGFIGDPDQALLRLQSLKAQGISLSIDDFGTGYSSLSYLTRMPVDELKIDRSFVSAIAGSPEATAVVQAAIEMGHSLGLSVVAEGIEDKGTAADLASLGCDVGQGYVYAKPMLFEDFEAWRRAHDASSTRVPEIQPTDTVVTRLRPKARRTTRPG